MLALWSGFEDAGFTARLRDAGFTVDVKRVLANGGSTPPPRALARAAHVADRLA